MTQPTILYVDCDFVSGIDRRRLDGMRRYAVMRKWRVETLEHKDCSPAVLHETMARLSPSTTYAPSPSQKPWTRPDAPSRAP